MKVLMLNIIFLVSFKTFSLLTLTVKKIKFKLNLSENENKHEIE